MPVTPQIENNPKSMFTSENIFATQFLHLSVFQRDGVPSLHVDLFLLETFTGLKQIVHSHFYLFAFSLKQSLTFLTLQTN